MASSTTHEIDILKARLWEKLETLPQRDLIDRSDAQQWIDYMANVMPQEAVWHMIRAGGVGGSEIGGLVRNYLGHRADHGFSAHEWAESKLLRATPTLPAGVLLRGHAMEPIHRERFYVEYDCKRDVPAYDKLSKAQGSLVWMRYSPDDVIALDRPTRFEQAGEGVIELQGRVLLDYKAPTTIDDNARIAFQYTCQLHQGAIICEEQGLELTGAMLSQFNWATWSLKNDFVTINPELCQLIKEAGNHYWDFVMRGEIPPYVMRKKLALDANTRDRWDEAAHRLAQLNAMQNPMKKAAEDLRAKLIAGLGLLDTRLEGQAISFPGALTISSTIGIDEDAVYEAIPEEEISSLMVPEKTTKYDTDAMLAKLRELQVDLKPFRKKTKLDPTLVFDALVAKGLDPENFLEETHRLTVAKEMKEQSQDWYDQSFESVATPEDDLDMLTPTADSAAAQNARIMPAGNRPAG